MSYYLDLIFIFIAYIVGCFLAYIYYRAEWKSCFNSYSIKDRNINLLFSSFSWIALLAFVLESQISKKDSTKQSN